jgi:cell division protein ZipA
MEQLLATATEDLRLALFALGALFLLLLVVWEIVQRRRQKSQEQTDAPDPLLEPVRRGHSPVAETASMSVKSKGAAASSEAFDLPSISVRDRLVEPTIVDFDSVDLHGSTRGLPVFDSASPTNGGISSRHDALFDDQLAGGKLAGDDLPGDPSISAAAADDERAAAEPVAQGDADGVRLEWPDEDRRQIVALRIVARADERFTGVSLRQALQGEGFRHGELDIFHRPLGDGRVLLSAASLTRPGGFDLSNMDSTLFLGLNLFAVLPGPLPGRETVDKLLLVGHTLAQRLRGDLRDSRGDVLSEARLAELRREAAAVDGKDSAGSS